VEVVEIPIETSVVVLKVEVVEIPVETSVANNNDAIFIVKCIAYSMYY
jgi:hypothetical protein